MQPSKASEFFSHYPARSFRKGESLVQAGDMPAAYYITEGTVVQYDISNSGNKLVLNLYKPGAFIPLSCILNDIPSSFFFEAAGHVSAHEAPRADVADWLKNKPDIVYDALARMSRGGDGLMRRLARAMEGDAEGRILSELTILAARFPNADNTVAISDTALAAQTGLARETVSRALKRLSERGIVSTRRGHITLHTPH